ncbi:MAG TPA: D-sedoheptulose 7-phosphate isomerase [Terracidiphilus sp.]|nr:D-sedoheptulose 7-phosphate isomerase [Terracidiphilus sp.]
MESSLTDFVRAELAQSAAVLQAVSQDAALLATLARAADAAAGAMKSGGKLLIAGNGGSAADAQHLAAEFVSRLVQDRPAMRAIALTTDTSALTAIGNDYGYERVFARQLEALGQSGDVFMAISTSGNSPNILLALELSRKMNLTTIGLTGKSGGKMAPLCDHCLRAPSDITMHIQEAHLALEHMFSWLAERAYFATELSAARPGTK